MSVLVRLVRILYAFKYNINFAERIHNLATPKFDSWYAPDYSGQLWAVRIKSEIEKN